MNFVENDYTETNYFQFTYLLGNAQSHISKNVRAYQ